MKDEKKTPTRKREKAEILFFLFEFDQSHRQKTEIPSMT
tara:strand:+ start:553 stop:669 length:117 start_codon:yes stop_codon:yes gene_type:complete